MAESRLIPRTASHLAVTGLVVVSVAIGVAAGTGVTDGRGFFDIVAIARGSVPGDSLLDSTASHYDLAGDPREIDPMPDRSATGLVAEPTPLPTPVAPPPQPTPRPVVVFSAPGPVVGNGQMAWPVAGGTITQYFSSYHPALDIAAPYGSRVISSDDGVVTWAGWRNNGGGLVVAVDHGGGFVTVYNHLGSIVVSVGQSVARGQKIAEVGCTGTCTGPHVHYEVIVDGVIVNPLRYL